MSRHVRVSHLLMSSCANVLRLVIGWKLAGSSLSKPGFLKISVMCPHPRRGLVCFLFSLHVDVNINRLFAVASLSFCGKAATDTGR